MSNLRFESYKIDSFAYQMKQNVGMLDFRGSLDLQFPGAVGVKLRKPTYIEKEQGYVVGLDCKIGIYEDNTVPPAERKPEDALVFVTAGIVGFFKSESGKLGDELEEKLIKFQMPAILFPYLRGAMTTFLNNAGFGSSVFPLINMQRIAEKQLKDISVEFIAIKTDAPATAP